MREIKLISRAHRTVLLDVSRLIWRLWSGRLPTGIDRVCLEYARHFAQRALAVVQFKGRIVVLGKAESQRLFGILTTDSGNFRAALLTLAPKLLLTARRTPPNAGMIYINVGHTGLEQPGLRDWIAARSVRAIYLIHDLIPVTHPQFCRAGEGDKHVARMRNALSSAAAIIANSQATLDELARFASQQGLPMPWTKVAWISGYSNPKRAAPMEVERPYFVTVGTIEARKNHLLLLNVWKRLVSDLGDSAPVLVIVGQRGWKAEAVTAILDDLGELEAHVRELGRCSDRELDEIIAGARALLMPSFVEGFGLPIIEALQSGTPVIAADLRVYREVAGAIPTYIDPQNESAWEAAVRAFASDSAERKRQKRDIAGFRPPDWAGHFASVDRFVDDLAPGWRARAAHPVEEI